MNKDPKGTREGWEEVVARCEQLLGCDDHAESPVLSNLPNLIRDLIGSNSQQSGSGQNSAEKAQPGGETNNLKAEISGLLEILLSELDGYYSVKTDEVREWLKPVLAKLAAVE